jgi:glutamate N-acetyltransferase/amino-acid N-acetyltransferase
MPLHFEASTTAVAGFRFAGAAAGIKAIGRPDLALAAAAAPVPGAGIFTTNLVRAAPVLVTAERLAGGQAQAILANAGCANACSGEAGMLATLETTAAVARALDGSPAHILAASTGVIGVPLPAGKVVAALPSLVASLSEKGADRFAEAILSTDRSPKVAHVTGEIGGRSFVMMGIAKGAGMIHPNMAPLVPHATMLAFLFTDAAADAGSLGRALSRVADRTFHQASVDGDTSTNDTLVIMASGYAGTELARPAEFAAPREIPSPLEEAMTIVCEHLARQMVADGEGAEHLVEIHVSGLLADRDAAAIARTIATSPLVKTALFGQDPNWGRVLGAAGRAGVVFDPSRARILVENVCIVDGGIGMGAEREAEARRVMARPSYRIDVELGEGPGRARYLTCDLGLGYIRCNADYRS